MTRALVVLGLILSLLAGCGSGQEEEFAFDGRNFRASLSQIGGDRQEFNISVRPVSASFEGARQAGRYEATRYCIVNYGTSAVDWVVGPDQEASTYPIENDTLMLRGTCEWR